MDIERYRTALRLRSEGKTFDEVGRALGVQKQRARQMVLQALRMIDGGEAEPVELAGPIRFRNYYSRLNRDPS